jgi:hypothetical protein
MYFRGKPLKSFSLQAIRKKKNKSGGAGIYAKTTNFIYWDKFMKKQHHGKWPYSWRRQGICRYLDLRSRLDRGIDTIRIDCRLAVLASIITEK